METYWQREERRRRERTADIIADSKLAGEIFMLGAKIRLAEVRDAATDPRRVAEAREAARRAERAGKLQNLQTKCAALLSRMENARLSYAACRPLESINFDGDAGKVLEGVGRKIQADLHAEADCWAVEPSRRKPSWMTTDTGKFGFFLPNPMAYIFPFALANVPGAEAEPLPPATTPGRNEGLMMSLLRKNDEYFEEMRKRQRARWETIRDLLKSLEQLHQLYAEYAKG